MNTQSRCSDDYYYCYGMKKETKKEKEQTSFFDSVGALGGRSRGNEGIPKWLR